MPYDPITLLSTLSTIALPPDTQDSLSVSWLDSYRMGFPPMKHYTLCWAHTDHLPAMIWNKGTKHEVFLPGSLLSFVLYVINLNGLLLQKSQELLPLHVALQIPILVLRLHDVIHNFYPVCSFRKVP